MLRGRPRWFSGSISMLLCLHILLRASHLYRACTAEWAAVWRQQEERQEREAAAKEKKAAAKSKTKGKARTEKERAAAEKGAAAAAAALAEQQAAADRLAAAEEDKCVLPTFWCLSAGGSKSVGHAFCWTPCSALSDEFANVGEGGAEVARGTVSGPVLEDRSATSYACPIIVSLPWVRFCSPSPGVSAANAGDT